jgi:hypothetical protein
MRTIITTLLSRELNEVRDIVANFRHAAREMFKFCLWYVTGRENFDCNVVSMQESNLPVERCYSDTE